MKKILLIEDDTVLRENTAELLELSGYEVLVAGDGKKGVMKALEFLPHIIICDIMMPELDGYGVLEELSGHEETKLIPFIYLSAKTERKDIRKGMELGADDYLTKPFEEDELVGAIESRLARIAILNDTTEKGYLAKDDSALRPRTIHQLKNFIDDNGRDYKIDQGASVYKEGGNANQVFLVLKGIVKTHKLDEYGKELITGIYKADDFFGFSSFTKNLPYDESATAMEDVQLVAIGKDELRHVLEENHQLTMELLHLLSEDLSDTKAQLLEMAYGSVRKKTASTILKFAEKLQTDPQGRLHILRSDLASVAGMATETLIRTLSSFKKEGLIQIEDRNIQILDVDALSRVH
jgi:CRP-like cAMP-binding protein